MSITEQYSEATSRTTGAIEKVADFWTQGARTLSNQWLPGLPQVDLIPAVERYFEFVQRTVDISRDVSIKFAEAGNKLSGVARERVESAGSVVREQAESARDLVHEQAAACARCIVPRVLIPDHPTFDLEARVVGGPVIDDNELVDERIELVEDGCDRRLLVVRRDHRDAARRSCHVFLRPRCLLLAVPRERLP